MKSGSTANEYEAAKLNGRLVNVDRGECPSARTA